MNFLHLSILLVLVKCVVASVDIRASLQNALETDSFHDFDASELLELNVVFDSLVTNTPDLVSNFINRFPDAKIPILAALLRTKSCDVIDEVLEEIEYDDLDLIGAMVLRDTPVGVHRKIFHLLAKVSPAMQKKAIDLIVQNMSQEGNHIEDAVSLMIAMENERPDLYKAVNGAAISAIFDEGIMNDEMDIVMDFYEHPALDYTDSLSTASDFPDTQAFKFVLLQADKSEFSELVSRNNLKPEDSQLAQEALARAGPKGTRVIHRPMRRAEMVLDILDNLAESGKWIHALGGIVASYLLDEGMWKQVLARRGGANQLALPTSETGQEQGKKRKKDQAKQAKRKKSKQGQP